MDLMVSYMTCYEMISQIRAWPEKYIKIVIMTRINQDQVIEQVFEMGVDDYVLLPLKRKEFLARIARLERYMLTA
jgi:CheY-like chemotaxis protein